MRVFPGPGAALKSLILILLASLPAFAAAEPLSLAAAERIALERDAGVAAARAESESLREMGVAASQLPDPEARAGLVNVPVDSFALDREDMTMLELGVTQRFPAGQTRQLTNRRYGRLADGADAEARDRALMTRREVRTAWFELAYLERADQVAAEQQAWLEALSSAATRAYAGGSGMQSDLLGARLELLELRERRLMYGRERAMRRAELVRWVGEAAGGELVLQFGTGGPLPSLADLERGAGSHPQVELRSAQAQAAADDVALARERYKPAFGLDVSYGLRQGSGMDGAGRPDLASAMLMFEVPLFTRDRQDREVASARAMQRSAEATREQALRTLLAAIAAAHGRAREQAELVSLYRDEGAKLAQVSAESALASFRAGGGDFMNVITTQGRAFGVRERLARAEADLAIVRAELDYLAGSQP